MNSHILFTENLSTANDFSNLNQKLDIETQMCKETYTENTKVYSESILPQIIRYKPIFKIQTPQVIRYKPIKQISDESDLNLNEETISENPSKIILGYDPLPSKEGKKYICNKNCKRKVNFHPLYVDSAICGCSFCEDPEEIAKRICEFRNFTFLSLEDNKVEFKCDALEQHVCEYKMNDFRMGRGCPTCKKEVNKKPEIVKIESECDCSTLGLIYRSPGGKPICQHYNFAATYPILALEWDFLLNDVLPNEITPRPNTKYWFRCEKYGICYKQRICDRITSNCICPYCSPHIRRTCNKNSLLSTHPQLCKEWDYDENFIYPNEVTRGSNYLAGWICPVNPEHKYKRLVSERACRNWDCLMCTKSYAQRVGGHEEFVKCASEIHNNKYTYPDEYVSCLKKINIYCPVISEKTKEPHGLFKQTPADHKFGYGCKKCFEERTDSKGIRYIKSLLDLLNYKYETEKTFEGLVYKDSLRIDIYLCVINEKGEKIQICIEFDGDGHFKIVPLWGGEEGLKKNQTRDLIKDNYFVKNGISLLRFPEKSLPTLEELKALIEKCKTTQVYKSYDHYISKMEEEIDFSKTNIEVIETDF
jgi:hypothetical protein